MPAVEPRLALPPRYRVVRHIANGGMASVWAAEDGLLERLVAVKVLGSGYAADPAARRRFTREARAAARVSDHPHVVTVYDIGESQADPPEAFIVMEHFSGGTVRDRLRGDGPVPVPTALRWLEEAASALDAAHAADVVHRDVKPGNLMLDDRGRLAVGDFGIASLAGETALTQAGQVLGTAAYLSPEQARGEPATPASDRYALAVVAYELLCGHRPFGGDTPAAQARAHLEAQPPTPTGPCDAAAGVLTAGLEKDPARRPRTATAFVQDLRDALDGQAAAGLDTTDATRRMTPVVPPPTAASVPREPRTPTPSPARRRREPVAAAAAGGDVVVPAGGPGVHGRRRRGPWPLAALAALLIAGAAVAAIIATGGSDAPADRASTSTAGTGSSDAERQSRQATTTASPPAAAAAPETTTQPQEPQQTQTAPAPAPAPTEGRSPSELNNTGFAMLPGDATGAVPLLQAAVDGFRAANAKGDINYAYALFNLGWALRLSGHADQAIPYLEERLQVSDYKRGIVRKELAQARQDAGMGAAAPTAAPDAQGKQRRGGKRDEDDD